MSPLYLGKEAYIERKIITGNERRLLNIRGTAALFIAVIGRSAAWDWYIWPDNTADLNKDELTRWAWANPG